MTDINKEEVLDLFLKFLEIEYKQISLVSRSMFKGIQGAQYRLLSYLNTIPMESMTNLGKTMYISKQYMTTLVDSLIKEGYVEREFDHKDRRVVCVKITKAGRENLYEIREQIKRNLSDRIEKLPNSDLELLYVSIQNIIIISNKFE
jgi:DNA-binding MarR family transcriptional regulator